MLCKLNFAIKKTRPNKISYTCAVQSFVGEEPAWPIAKMLKAKAYLFEMFNALSPPDTHQTLVKRTFIDSSNEWVSCPQRCLLTYEQSFPSLSSIE